MKSGLVLILNLLEFTNVVISGTQLPINQKAFGNNELEDKKRDMVTYIKHYLQTCG